MDQWAGRQNNGTRLHRAAKRKRIWKSDDVLRTCGTTWSRVTSILWESQKRREKRAENLFEEIVDENFPSLEKDTHLGPGSSELQMGLNPKRATPRYNENVKKVKENLKSNQRTTTYVQRKPTPEGYQQVFHQKLCKPEGSSMIYSKCWEEILY